MSRSGILACGALLLLPAIGSGTAPTALPAPSATGLSAAQILEKNAAARGGLAAWHAVNTLSLSGKMEAGGNARSTLAMPVPGDHHPHAGMPTARPQEQTQLPFVLQLKRPLSSRLEIQFQGQTAVQVFDGSQGWKVRPFLNRHQVESFTPEELRTAASQAGIDGPLMDAAARGITVSVAGKESVDGREAYKLTLTSKDKQIQNVWVDAKSFLEVKMDGTPRRLDGRYHPVAVYLRNYKTVSGLVVPTLLETAVQGVAGSEKIAIANVEVNPTLADARFSKPQ